MYAHEAGKFTLWLNRGGYPDKRELQRGCPETNRPLRNGAAVQRLNAFPARFAPVLRFSSGLDIRLLFAYNHGQSGLWRQWARHAKENEMALTRRQKHVLDFLVEFISRNGYSPSFEEIGESLGLSSVATVHKHVGNLEKKGFIRRGYNQSRSIDVVAMPGPVKARILGAAGGRKAAARGEGGDRDSASLTSSMEYPLLGRIAAGYPVEAIASSETFSLSDFVRARGEIFVLKVKGDSMIDDHICDGDYILVERSSEASSGEIVVALVNGTEATLKRLFHETDGNLRLQPANAQMDPIILPARDVRVQGRVMGVLRKY